MKSVKVQSHQNEVEVFEDKIIITPKGILSSSDKGGLKGSKEIPFVSISSIEFREAGVISDGYLRFCTPWSKRVEWGYTALQDENSIVFNKEKNEAFKKLREFISKKISSKTSLAPKSHDNIKLEDLENYVNEIPPKLMKSIKIRLFLSSEVEVFEDRIILKYLWPKEIPFVSISSIKFKEGGLVFDGYLLFGIVGDEEDLGGYFEASFGEKGFIFGASKNEVLRKLKEFISSRISSKTSPVSNLQHSITLEDLEKSAQKRQVGFLFGMGVFVMPYIFSWFTLQKGYSSLARVTCFTWMIIVSLCIMSI